MTTIAHPRVAVNGIVVANFSSPHAFLFQDGTELQACPPEMAESLKLDAQEAREQHPALRGVTDIRLDFTMTPNVQAAIERVNADVTVDVVLVPLPVMTAMKAAGMPIGKCRVCRVADRVTRAIHADKFCV